MSKEKLHYPTWLEQIKAETRQATLREVVEWLDKQLEWSTDALNNEVRILPLGVITRLQQGLDLQGCEFYLGHIQTPDEIAKLKQGEIN